MKYRILKIISIFLACAIFATSVLSASAVANGAEESSFFKNYTRAELIEYVIEFDTQNGEAAFHPEWFTDKEAFSAFKIAYEELVNIRTFKQKYTDEQIMQACENAKTAFEILVIDRNKYFTVDELLDKLIYRLSYALVTLYSSRDLTSEQLTELKLGVNEAGELISGCKNGEDVTPELLYDTIKRLDSITDELENDIEAVFNTLSIMFNSVLPYNYSYNLFLENGKDNKYAYYYMNGKAVLEHAEEYNLTEMHIATANIIYTYINLEGDWQKLYSRDRIEALVNKSLEDYLPTYKNLKKYVSLDENKQFASAYEKLTAMLDDIDIYNNLELLDVLNRVCTYSKQLRINADKSYTREQVLNSLGIVIELYRADADNNGLYVDNVEFKDFKSLYSDLLRVKDDFDNYTNQYIYNLVHELQDSYVLLRKTKEPMTRERMIKCIKNEQELYSGDYLEYERHTEKEWSEFAESYRLLYDMFPHCNELSEDELLKEWINCENVTDEKILDAWTKLEDSHCRLITNYNVYVGVDKARDALYEIYEKANDFKNKGHLYSGKGVDFLENALDKSDVMLHYTGDYTVRAILNAMNMLNGAMMLLTETV